MNQKIEAIFTDLKEKHDQVEKLRAIERQEVPKLDKLMKEQDEVFDFNREEQIQNKKAALAKLKAQIKKHTDVYREAMDYQELRLNRIIRQDKRRLIKDDSTVIEKQQRVEELEQELAEATQALRDAIYAFDERYNDELDEIGNDEINFRLDPINPDNY